MDGGGLKKHWLIGKSDKRELAKLPRGRPQIGKFGIGKLATYVLANRLTHISKRGKTYYSTSMDFSSVDARGEEEVEPRGPIRIPLRKLTEEQAREALEEWRSTLAYSATKFKLFGKSAPNTWTFAILSDLKEKVHEIRRGRLAWVLRTALPLRDDFAIYLDGEQLEPSKASKGLVKTWVLGKEIVDLQKPASDDLEVNEDKGQPRDSAKRYGLLDSQVGRITGYAEMYRDLLTGSKSDDVGRSHGFFVYVLGRLINAEDGHFGISANELRHGTFNRIRIVVHMDGLDAFLQSDRERIREGPMLESARNFLHGLFNWIRPHVEALDAQEEPGTKLARKLGGSPASVSRRPIIEMARAALAGKIRSRYILLPVGATAAENNAVIESLELRASKTPEKFVASLDFSYGGTAADGIAVYDAATGQLRVNGLHPFVGAFFDEFTGGTSGLPLEVFAMAEVLLESHLYQAGLDQAQIDAVMGVRDELLRYAAKESGRMTPLMVANNLRNARNNQDQLEIWVVEAFRNLGFAATRLGKTGKPDGIAEALLAPDAKKRPQRYKVSLEAKSKEKAGAKVSAKAVGISTVARHRDNFGCQHAIVVGQLFPRGDERSALAVEVGKDRTLTQADGDARTITLINIDDLADLVQHRPVKALTLQRIRAMLQENSMPEECKQWIAGVLAEKPVRPDYATILNAIALLQAHERNEPVEYSEVRNELRHTKPPVDYADLNDLRDVCLRMAGLVPDEIDATNRTIALNQAVPNILAKLRSATSAHLADRD